jgi:hypothetical protein
MAIALRNPGHEGFPNEQTLATPTESTPIEEYLHTNWSGLPDFAEQPRSLHKAGC